MQPVAIASVDFRRLSDSSDMVGIGLFLPAGLEANLFEKHALGNLIDGAEQIGQFAVAHFWCVDFGACIVKGAENGEAHGLPNIVVIRVHNLASGPGKDGLSVFPVDDLGGYLGFDGHAVSPC